MAVFDLTEAETIFDQLMDRACSGEEIVLAQDGKPVARLIPFATTLAPSGQQPDEFIGL